MLTTHSAQGLIQRRRGGWIPWIFVAGMLAVVAVNGTLIYFAFESWAGVSVTRAYERGLGYNRVLAAASQEEALGWQASVAFRRAEPAGSRGELVLDLRNHEGQPLDGARLAIELVRPLEALAPLPVAMMPTGAGVYTGEIDALPRPGRWDVRIAAMRDGETVHLVRRIFVP
jgi:nitrogen fixation protein FixH